MKIAPTYQKLRGGYYTPKPIADFLAQWAIQSPTAEILEPSCGDGAILEAAVNALILCGADRPTIVDLIQGVELDAAEASKAVERIHSLDIHLPREKIYVGDFFSYAREHLVEERFFDIILSKGRAFDAIIGNPPFIRYQNFPEEYRNIAFDIMKHAGLHPNKLTNSWLPFLVVSTLLLKDRGRLAMVIPAELFQVNYAAETRRYLSDFYSEITLVTFKKLVFDDIEQEIILLLGKRNGHKESRIRVLEFENAKALAGHRHVEFIEAELKPMDHSTEKWTQYFLSSDEILLLRLLKSHPLLTLSGNVLDINVGIVTGENKFFILNEQQVKEASLEPFTQKVVSRSAHLKGAIFCDADWMNNAMLQVPAFLLHTPEVPFEKLPEPLRKYIESGEQRRFNEGYKCKIRSPWYVVPSAWIPQAFMLRQIHGYPKIILNQAEVTCTDTIHRVKFLKGVDGRKVTAAFINTLTFAFAEVTGRSYGGGVLTFEPSETENLPLPLQGAENLDLDYIDKLLRTNDVNAVLAITDEVLLKKALGLDIREVNMLHAIWNKLKDRRTNRKHKSVEAVFERDI